MIAEPGASAIRALLTLFRVRNAPEGRDLARRDISLRRIPSPRFSPSALPLTEQSCALAENF